MKKRLLPIILVCCMLAALFAVSVTAADDIVASGDCGASGSSVQWALDSKGTLTISGTGVIKDYNGFTSSKIWKSHAPWSYAANGSTGNGDMITSLVINNGITCVGTNAFVGLVNLTKVSLPDTLIRIKENAFRRCTSLTKITFPNSVASIENGVFWDCSNLLDFTICDGVTGIGEKAFYECDRLTKMVVPQSVENISESAFGGCDKLQGVTILGNISAIKKNAFQNCPALTEITIPESVLIIEETAFSGCTALKDVYYTGTENMWKAISVDSGNTPLDSATIHTDTSPEAAYRINGITVSDNDGKKLSAIPNGAFFATVSITNRTSGTTPLIFLAAYSSDGKFQNFMYVTVKEAIGATTEVTLPVDNSAGNIAELKAFAVSSIGGFAPLGASVSYP